MISLIAVLALSGALQEEDDLVYVKRETRAASQEASVKATLRKLPRVEAGPWRLLRGELRRGLTSLPDLDGGGYDLSGEFRVRPNRAARWEDGASYADGTLHDLPTGTTWYRAVEAEADWVATVTITTQQNWDCWVNDRAVSLATHKSTYLLPSRRLDFRVPLKKGVNHLLVKIDGPSKFFFSLTPFGAELQIALRRRLDADFPGTSEQHYYRLETVPLPPTLVLEVGGMAFAADGGLVVCTRRGEIWKYRKKRWRRFASGLHQPLGILAEKNGDLLVVQKPEITRVRDADGDGKAETFETVTDGWTLGAKSGGFFFGPVRDTEGNLFIATSSGGSDGTSHRGWCLKMGPDGTLVPWASGLRTPNGLGFDGQGNLFITDNQGQYLGTSKLHHIEKGKFYGHPDSLSWHPEYKKRWPGMSITELDSIRTPAAVLFPHGAMGRSPSQPLCDTTGGKFGPFEGQLFVGDQSSCVVMRVALDRVGNAFQGACFPFRRDFNSGNNRLAFDGEGRLWVGQTDRGYGAIGGRPFGLERLTWSGALPMEIRSMKLTREGFDLVFTKPVDASSAGKASAYSLQHYHYHYHATYGSPRVDPTPVKPKAVRISKDGRTVSLILPELVKRKVYELHLRGVRAADGSPVLHPEAYYTLNRLRSE